ncbi:sulfite exporter TauE/SafE family protein [Variovorax sp. UC74_104]|uniref:sulfite exporter TauE/SafE family protein n=1 Tax=Variovorax sp. UC74_104 TaxID=3374555 RepID=UPI0037568DD5
MPEAFSLVQVLGGLAIGVFSGAVGGLLGVSPGGALVPALALMPGLGQHEAQAVSLAAQLVPTGFAGFLRYRVSGHGASWRTVAWISFGFLAGAWLGARGASHVADAMLRWMFVGYLLLLATLVVLKSPARADDGAELAQEPRGTAAALAFVGVVAGASSGLLGIGGGLAITALLTVALRYPQHRAQAASLAVNALPLALPAVFVYASVMNGLPWVLLGCVVLGLWIGTAAGARLATRLDERALRKYFFVLVICMALLMACRALGAAG